MRELGVLIGAMEHGYSPDDFDYIKSQAAVWDREGGPAGRLLIKAARDVMVATGRGQTAPAFHLHFLSKSADWNEHTKEVARDVAEILEIFDPMRKQAFKLPDVVGAGAAAGKGALLGSMALGGGLGSLYWLLSRHANQDSADIEAMQRQVNYYDELGRELEDSMRRKYRYERGNQQPSGAPTQVAPSKGAFA
jgi:hypothetical protein